MIAAHPGFVVELTSKLVKSHIGDRTGEAAVCQHALHVEVLDGNAGKVLGQIACQFVQSILANASNAIVQACRMRALCRLFEPWCLPESRRESRRSFLSPWRSGFGPSNISPFESVARRLTPK